MVGAMMRSANSEYATYILLKMRLRLKQLYQMLTLHLGTVLFETGFYIYIYIYIFYIYIYYIKSI